MSCIAKVRYVMHMHVMVILTGIRNSASMISVNKTNMTGAPEFTWNKDENMHVIIRIFSSFFCTYC